MNYEYISNTSRVAQQIKKNGTISRSELINTLSLSHPTVLQIVKQLSEKQIIYQDGQLNSRSGRKANTFAINKELFYAIGLDITRNHLNLVLVNLGGELYTHKRIRLAFADSAAYYAEITKILCSFLSENQIDHDKVLGVGLSLPGILSQDMRTLNYSHILNLRNYSLNKLEQCCMFPILAQNDANAAALAEITMLPDVNNMAFLSLSNSVGGALFLGGNLYTGDNGHSAEFGHLIMVPDGKECYCGKHGCFDAYCSALRLSEPFQDNLEAFFNALEKGDRVAKSIWSNYIHYLALMCNHLMISFDCTLILGGYVGAYLEPYLNDLRDEIESMNIFEPIGDRICCCHYKTASAAVGAALLHIDQYMNNL